MSLLWFLLPLFWLSPTAPTGATEGVLPVLSTLPVLPELAAPTPLGQALQTEATRVYEATVAHFHPPLGYRACIVRNRTGIEETLRLGTATHGVPMPLLAAVGYLETHLGCAAGSGGNWGAPIDRLHRHTAGPPLHAARALARSYTVCRAEPSRTPRTQAQDWLRATSRFRCGLCRCSPAWYAAKRAHHAYVPEDALRHADAIAAQVPTPALTTPQ